MTLEIFVRPVENGFMATVLGLPDCSAEAPTREEAIAQARQEAKELMAVGEFVRVEVDDLNWEQTRGAGMWADNELFDEFVGAMQEYRRQIDADPNQP